MPFSWTGVTSSPIVYRDQIIIASGDGNVTALALNGTKLWNTKIASSIYFSSPSAKDGYDLRRIGGLEAARGPRQRFRRGLERHRAR